MSARLPNPHAGTETHLKGQAITLREALVHQEETSIFQRNTDVNTFKGQIESKGGLKKISDSLIKDVSGGGSLQGVQKSIDDEKKDETAETKKQGSGLRRAFDTFIEPFDKLRKTQGALINFNKFDVGLEQGAERFNSGMKELTNGVGSLGPVINAFKTGLFKAQAVFNVMIGTVQMLGAGLIRMRKLPGVLMDGFKKLMPIIEGRKDLVLDSKYDEAVDAAKAEQKTADDKRANIEAIWVKLHPISMGEITDAIINGGDAQSLGDSTFQHSAELQKQKSDILDEQVAAQRKVFKAQKERTGAQTALQKKSDNRFWSKRSVANNKAELRAKVSFAKNSAIGMKNSLIERKDNAKKYVFEKAQYGKQKLFEKVQTLKKSAFEKGLMIKNAMLRGLIMLAPFIAVGAALALTWKAIEDGAVAALARAATLMTDKVTSIFRGLRNGLHKLFPKLIGPAKVTSTAKTTKPLTSETPDKKPNAKPKLTPGKIGGQLLKRIPGLGAVAESGMDAYQQDKKMDLITDAFEKKANVIEGEDGNLRPMTKEEYEMAVKANRANMTGSVGKGAGGFGGALAGGAAGAAIGSVIPVVGTLIGGIVGSLIGGLWGSKKGDEVATNIAADMQGIEDPQAMIDSLATNAEAANSGDTMSNLQSETSDLKVASSGGGSVTTNVSNVNNSSSSESVSYVPDGGQDNNFAYST